jgi:ectoine hydroxylase-related dioxygenase (phytanoyl-CoA dioxygenase family)
VGSEQGMHQDSAYVVTTPARKLLGVWIALEDVAPGSGELQYYAGSHRIGQFRFARGGEHFVPDPCDPNEHDRYERHLESEVARLDCELRKFRARRGDVLVWHADLVHGGAPILRSGAGRRSLVGHYCPASAAPDYFRAGPERARRAPWEGHAYASANYPVD